jgi:hypothetical protein
MEIGVRCQREERLLITQDLDFADFRKFQPGSHFGIVLVRIQHPGRAELLNLLSWVFGTQDVESWNRCLVIVSDDLPPTGTVCKSTMKENNILYGRLLRLGLINAGESAGKHHASG